MLKFTIISFAFMFLSQHSLAAEKHLIVLGDSLTEGYQVQKKESFPSLLDEKINKNEKVKIKVTNAGVSGSTSASGLSRLKWLLKTNPTHMILALGANDGLRGLKPEDTKKNLTAIITLAKEKKIKILLAGMQMPPNYGKAYTEKFANIYTEIAKEQQIELYPFLLADVAGEPLLNISDGIHPNPKGYQKIADNIYPFVRKLLHD